MSPRKTVRKTKKNIKVTKKTLIIQTKSPSESKYKFKSSSFRIVKIKRRLPTTEKEEKPTNGFVWKLPEASASTGLFGNKSSEPAKNQQGSLFGEATKPLFGSGVTFGDPSSGSLFGNKPTDGGSLFSFKPVDGGSLFGAKPVEGGGLFGAKPATGTSLFPSLGAAPVGSLFDSKNSLFGNQTSIFAKPKEDKLTTEKPEGGDSDDAYEQEVEPPSMDLKD